MKISIKSLLATGIIAIVLSTSTVYANDVITKTISASSADISSIKRVFISGNVEVTIAQAPTAKSLYTNDGHTRVNVKQVGNSLYIDTKNTAEDAKITIYVNEIYRIDASENAVVKTADVLNLKFLQVFLKDNAKVDINSKTESLYTVVKNSSELKLKGSTDFHTIVTDKLSKITMEKFNALKTDMSSSSVEYAALKN